MADPCTHSVMQETEEGKKVSRNNGSKWLAIYERLEDTKAPLSDDEDAE